MQNLSYENEFDLQTNFDIEAKGKRQLGNGLLGHKWK